VDDEAGQAVGPDEDRVEVAARTAGGERVVTRVDVVRADLERRGAGAAGGEGCVGNVC